MKVISQRPLKLEGQEMNILIDRLIKIKTESREELEQLKNLLKQTLRNEELIEKIKKIEGSLNTKIYTDQKICNDRFGQNQCVIELKKDIVIANIASRIFLNKMRSCPWKKRI